jgi:hypothetical protein
MASNLGSRLFKAIMGLTLIAMGTGGTIFLWLSWQRAEETRSWKPVEAIVTVSEVLTERATPHSPPGYTPEVRYRYQYNGGSYTSHRIKRVDGPSSHKEAAEAVVAEHRPGKTVTCYVNPAQPDFAVLEQDSRAALYSIWFPLLFIVGGGGMIVSAFRSKA